MEKERWRGHTIKLGCTPDVAAPSLLPSLPQPQSCCKFVNCRPRVYVASATGIGNELERAHGTRGIRCCFLTIYIRVYSRNGNRYAQFGSYLRLLQALTEECICSVKAYVVTLYEPALQSFVLLYIPFPNVRRGALLFLGSLGHFHARF